MVHKKLRIDRGVQTASSAMREEVASEKEQPDAPDVIANKAWDRFLANPSVRAMRVCVRPVDRGVYVEFVRRKPDEDLSFVPPEDDNVHTRFVLVNPKHKKVDPKTPLTVYSQETLMREKRSGCKIHYTQVLASHGPPKYTRSEETVATPDGRTVCNIVEYKCETDATKGQREVALDLGTLLHLEYARKLVYVKKFAEGGFTDAILGYGELEDIKPVVVVAFDRETLKFLKIDWVTQPRIPAEKEIFKSVALKLFGVSLNDEVRNLRSLCFKACERLNKLGK